MTWTSDSQFVTAAEAARILGMTRGQVVELATSAAEFPAADATATGERRWPQAWAAAHPDRGPLDPGLNIPPIGEWCWQVRKGDRPRGRGGQGAEPPLDQRRPSGAGVAAS
jgi:hypothetical protein